MNFASLKSNVQSALGRTDIPDYVYSLTTSGINRDLRVLEMQCTTTLYTNGGTASLPSDFLEAESVYIDDNGGRSPLIPATELGQATRYDESGRPYYYAVHNDEITLMPEPDTDYEIELRYYAKLDDFSADADTNDVITAYPGLFLYGALTHAAIWQKDDESAATYNKAYTAELTRLEKADTKRRFSGPTVQRSARSIP